MKYYANYTANNGTTLMNPLTGTNKNELIKDIRHLANGERFDKNTCSWCVWIEKNGDAVEVAAGGTDCNGRMYRTI
jgi:hypothetical protein